MRKLLTLTAIGYMAAGLLTGCSLAASQLPTTPAPAPAPDNGVDRCPPGDVVVWDGDPITCDLVGGMHTLVVLGMPNEAACDDAGGRWVYEACEDVDY